MKLHLAKTVLLLHCWIAHSDSTATAQPSTGQQVRVTCSLPNDPPILERPGFQNVADQCGLIRQCRWRNKTDWSAGHRWLTDFRQFFGQRWLRPHALQHLQSKVKASIRAWAVTPHDVACYGLLMDGDCLTAAPDLPVVILIHGFNSTPEASTELREAVQRAGYPTGTFAYPNDYTLAASAGLLSSDLKEFSNQHPNRRVILLCHSMGGLVARGCLEEAQSDPGNVDRLIMISPPNHGTNLALFAIGTDLWEHWVDRADGSTWERLHDSVIDGLGEAVTELCPESEFLKRLNSQTRNPRVAYSIL
ncbi:MAG: alpha/beta fold hydrolase, partial [Mariniblastus sp.]|nr:alpha/beta fold hydrolase [Mariniblastus sp.]